MVKWKKPRSEEEKEMLSSYFGEWSVGIRIKLKMIWFQTGWIYSVAVISQLLLLDVFFCLSIVVRVNKNS